MDKNIKKILVIFVILFLAITISVNVKAVTIHETTNTNDGYDTIEEGTIIIGTTKFSPNTIITAVRAAVAGANDMKVYLAKGGDPSLYNGPTIYIYAAQNDWYEVYEDGSIKPISPIAALDIYYVDNKPKTGLDSVTGEEISTSTPEEETTYNVTFMSKSSVYSEEVVKEGGTVAKPENDPVRAGYIFLGWYKDDELYDFDTVITEDTIITAEYKVIDYDVVLDETVNGTLSADPQTSVNYGDIIKFVVTPDEGYALVDGSLVVKDSEGNTVELTGSNTFTMPASDVIISAEFAKTKATRELENDSAVSFTVETFMEKVEASSDEAIINMEYNESTNKVILVVNKEEQDNAYVIDYADDFTEVVMNVAKEAESISYTIDGVLYNVDLTALTENAIKVEVGKMLLNLTGREISTSEALSLTLADIAGKSVEITAQYKNNVVLDYSFMVESVKTEETINNENDIILSDVADSFTDPLNEGIAEIVYEPGTDTVTFVVNEEKQDEVELINYEDIFSPMILNIAQDVKTISYEINGVEYNVDCTSLSENLIRVEAAKLLLRLVGGEVSGHDALLLKLSDVVGKNVTISADYGYGAVIDYTFTFQN